MLRRSFLFATAAIVLATSGCVSAIFNKEGARKARAAEEARIIHTIKKLGCKDVVVEIDNQSLDRVVLYTITTYASPNTKFRIGEAPPKSSGQLLCVRKDQLAMENQLIIRAQTFANGPFLLSDALAVRRGDVIKLILLANSRGIIDVSFLPLFNFLEYNR